MLLKYIMKDGRVFTNSNSNANVVGGAYMRSPFKYTECGLSYHRKFSRRTYYVTNGMKAGSGGGVSGPAVAEPLPELLHLNTATPGVYTTDLGFGQFGSTCWGDSPATSAGARVRWFCNNSNWWR
jgi:hypothetical protein